MQVIDPVKAQLFEKPVLLDSAFNPAEFVFEEDAPAAQLIASAVYMAAFDRGQDGTKPYAVSDGVAVIPVTGMLLNRYPYASPYATGYNAISSMLTQALADPTVKAIAFDVNSPGGMVMGCFELCDQIFAARGQKPMAAIVDGSATSAAYAIASSVGNVSAPKSARVGSVGVVTMHADLSEMLDKEGVKITYIYAGDHKIDGSPYKPLTKDMKATVQKDIDAIYQEFVSSVARNRGIDAKTVQQTEAAVYGAQEAKGLGLIDSVASPSDAFAAFVSGLSGSTFNSGVSAMTNEVKPGDSVKAPDAAAIAAASATAASAAVTAERERASGILALPEAKDKTALATHLAHKTDMSVEQAKGILAASPAEVKEAKGTDNFKKVMDDGKHPDVSAGGGGADDKKVTAASMLANYQAATGYKPAK